MDLFAGVDFMPLTSGTDYLDAECLMTRLTAEFPLVKHTVFLYQQRLIQYTVEKPDLIPLFRFIVDSVISYSLQLELQPEVGMRRMSIGSSDRRTREGSFVQGISEESDYWGELTAHGFPRVYLHDGASRYKPYELVSYVGT